MNPDKCNAPHTHIASFFCDQLRDHTTDHGCWDSSGNRIVWVNWEGRRSNLYPEQQKLFDEMLHRGWTRIDLDDAPDDPNFARPSKADAARHLHTLFRAMPRAGGSHE